VWGIELGVMVCMILFNSVFAGYEIALASISLGKLELLARQHKAGAAAAVRMKTSIEASLAVVQLGITLVGVIAAATGGAGAEESIEPYLLSFGFTGATAQLLAIALVVAPLTIITIIFGELIPKVFSMRNNEWVCLRLSPIMEWFSIAVWPVVWSLERSVMLLMSWGARMWGKQPSTDDQSADSALQELRAVASIARTSRLIGLQEERIIVNAARLSSTKVAAIQLPAQYISMLSTEQSMNESLITAHHDMHTRFPVTEVLNDPQRIIGYVNFKDIVSTLRISPKDATLRGILRPLPRLREDMSISLCMEKLIHERIHIALIVDASNHVTGMITLEDILEELIGEIHDEYDRLPSHITRVGYGWIIGGHASISHIREVTGIELPALPGLPGLPALPGLDGEPVPTTLNEWTIKRLGRPVKGGESISDDGLRVVVRKVRRQQVLEAHVTRQA
jgi:putative hemolysin